MAASGVMVGKLRLRMRVAGGVSMITRAACAPGESVIPIEANAACVVHFLARTAILIQLGLWASCELSSRCP
eukprot:1278932-Pyramimonas_sp.AAC.1